MERNRKGEREREKIKRERERRDKVEREEGRGMRQNRERWKEGEMHSSKMIKYPVWIQKIISGYL